MATEHWFCLTISGRHDNFQVDYLRAVFDVDVPASIAAVDAAAGNIDEVVQKIDRRVIRAAIALEDEELVSSFIKASPEAIEADP